MRSGNLAAVCSLALVLVLSLAGCGGSGASPPPVAPPPAPAASAEASAASAAPAPAASASASGSGGVESAAGAGADLAAAQADSLPVTRVLEPGKAPRRALRYTFKLAPEWLEMDLSMTMAMGMGARPGPPVHVPTVRMWTRIDPNELTPAGDVRCTFLSERVQVLDDVKVPAQMRAQLEKEMAGIVGLKGSSRISPRGVATEVEFSLPPAASDSLRKSMDSMRDAIRKMYIPLPEEEVGVGARWQTTSKMPLSGATMDVTTTYTLKELRADGMRADVDVTMTAQPKQTIKLATLPPGSTAVLESMSGQGSGKVSPGFARLAGEGTTHVTVDSAFDISFKGEHVRMTVHAETTASARPSKGAPAAKPAPKAK